MARQLIEPMNLQLSGSLQRRGVCKATGQLAVKSADGRHPICKEEYSLDIDLCRQPPVLLETKCLGPREAFVGSFSCFEVSAVTMAQEAECQARFSRVHSVYRTIRLGCQAKKEEIGV